MQAEQRVKTNFLWLWSLVIAVKLVIAVRLPLFVDEAFYWQEGRHLAAAYSDLPGLTAWLARLGVSLGGNHVLALRLPFLAIAALLPWLIAHIARRWFGAAAGWRAGIMTMLMPLSATLGVLAVPDVPMALAAVLCLDAGARLLRRIDAASALELAVGLMIGGLSHYRFIGVIGVGLIALLLLPQGRAMLRDVRIWLALMVGAVVWLPLLAWNVNHDEAGLRFQLIDRHPWSFHASGAWFMLIQIVLVTPLLALAMARVVQLGAFSGGVHSGALARPQWRYFSLIGAISTLVFFVFGFFSDAERISFHWPLPGYLALLVVAPVVLVQWSRRWRRLTWGVALLGMLAAYGYYLAASLPALREQVAGQKYYPRNFAGWDGLADAVRSELERMPEGTRLLADNFKVAAELGFQLNNPDIQVLDSPLNGRHGRSEQLHQWGLLSYGARDHDQLLVLSPSDYRYRELLQRYHQICAMVGPLPPVRVVSSDHGFRRFLLLHLPAQRQQGVCIAPAMAWIDVPEFAAQVAGRIEVTGWAFKDGVGLREVEVLLDGRVIAQADYGHAYDVRPYWKISNDPGHPNVGFRAQVDTDGLQPGGHWLSLRLHGNDGSVEDWPEQLVKIVQ
jgi:4-amino-4-deoxy-L-arabinose transferase-like glycosyltransferase